LEVDAIDLAQARQQDDIDHALAARKVSGPGADFCTMEDCGEPISEQRKAMGATRCVDCQADHEREALRWAPRAYA
jgi:RNA polymerase-binding transcription factor DksA